MKLIDEIVQHVYQKPEKTDQLPTFKPKAKPVSSGAKGNVWLLLNFYHLDKLGAHQNVVTPLEKKNQIV